MTTHVNPFVQSRRAVDVVLALVVAAVLSAAPCAFGQDAPVPRTVAPRAVPASSQTLDAILKDLAAWDGGIESSAVWALRDHVRARKDDTAGRAACEAQLLLFMKSSATPAARMVASRSLRTIAGDSAVPALQAMLSDDRASDLALYVLQPMPGAAAGRALLAALPVVRGPARMSVIVALGERRDAEAVPALVPLLGQADLAAPAARALGTIGGTKATDALLAASSGASAALKPVVAGAALHAAEQALATKRTAEALRVYDGLAADASLPPHIREAAVLGRISSSGPRAAETLVEYLGSSDARLQEAAISRIVDWIPAGAIGPVCAALPRLVPASQVKLLAVLSHYPMDAVLPAIRRAVASDDGGVRLAAVKALGSVGDDTVVALLIDTAAKAKGPEQTAARTAINGLKGDLVDTALMSMLSQKPDAALEGELLLAVADRRIFVAKGAVVAALASPTQRLRVQALRALRGLGTPSDIPSALDRLVGAADEAEATEAESTVVALAVQQTAGQGRARAITARLKQEKTPEARVQLLGVLALVGDSQSLSVVRTALTAPAAAERDAAVRALASWPNESARDDVFQLARDARDETQRLLAIRGFVRLAALDKYRLPSAVVADLQLAAGFCWRVEEQRLVLGALGDFPCEQALRMANGLLAVPGLEKEASAAVGKIEARLKAGLME